MAPFLLKPKVAEHLSTITLNLTESMVEHYSKGKNRSWRIINVMNEYLGTFSDDVLTGTDKRKIITISKPPDALYAAMYRAIKCGLAISRSELFRHALRWDMQRDSKTKKNLLEMKRERLEEDAKNGVIRVPTDEPKELVYKVIGIA